MFAKVLRLRQMGVLLKGATPPEDQWATGIFEMSSNGFGGPCMPLVGDNDQVRRIDSSVLLPELTRCLT